MRKFNFSRRRALHRLHAPALLVCLAAAATATAWAGDTAETVHPQLWPASRPAAPLNANTEERIDRLLATLSPEDKVGQLIQADIDSIKPADLRKYRLGSILAGGNAAPGGNLRASGADWLDLVDEFFRASVAGGTPEHPAIPLLFGIDAVHGHAHIPGVTVFPHNVGLGAAHDPELLERIGHATAEEVAATGIDWTFAPTVAVVRDVRWGRSYESYSEDPALVATYSRAMVSGLQGRAGTDQFMAPGHTLGSVKHFLGDGATVAGRDQFDGRSDERTLRDVHGAGYPAAIDAGTLTVMASYNGWQGTKMHANRALLTDVLKDRWGFTGFVVGDWNAQEEIPGCTKFDCPAALLAGLDMYMAPDSWQKLYDNLLAAVKAGRIPQRRLDDAVRRILRVKIAAGIFDKGPPKTRPDAGRFERLGSPEHRAIAREAVRKSLVLLKNNRGVLPLDPRDRILVAGPGADDIGMQSGGWTIDWQGNHNTNADFPGGTSIFGGIKAAVAAGGGAVVLSPTGVFEERPSAAIVVFGETPYAEFQGDRETLEFSPGDSSSLQILRRLQAAGIPVISVFISGRPMWVNRELNASDAFVAAWLPGSEGAGIADLLFKHGGSSTPPDFTGRLGFSWPATAMPVAFTDSGHVTGALFERGFGLSLAQRQDLGRLPEDPEIPDALSAKDTLFHANHVTAPWSIYVSDATAEVRLTMAAQKSPTGAVTAELAPPVARATWSGQEPGEFRIGGRAADYRKLAHEGAAVVVRYRVETPPTQAVKIGVLCEEPAGSLPRTDTHTPAIDWRKCGTPSGADLDVTAQLTAAPVGSWQELSVPLICLQDQGADLSNVASLFAVQTPGKLAVSFSEIRLARQDTAPSCQSRRLTRKK